MPCEGVDDLKTNSGDPNAGNCYWYFGIDIPQDKERARKFSPGECSPPTHAAESRTVPCKLREQIRDFLVVFRNLFFPPSECTVSPKKVKGFVRGQKKRDQ